jgi:hypothetical protein
MQCTRAAPLACAAPASNTKPSPTHPPTNNTRPCHRYVNGSHYSRTLEAWLRNHDKFRKAIMPIFSQV